MLSIEERNLWMLLPTIMQALKEEEIGKAELIQVHAVGGKVIIEAIDDVEETVDCDGDCRHCAASGMCEDDE